MMDNFELKDESNNVIGINYQELLSNFPKKYYV